MTAAVHAPRVPRLPPQTPQARSWWRRSVGTALLALGGWRVVGNMPDVPKFVLIVAPHTSNWDFVYGFFAYLALDFETRWFVKHTAVPGPIRALAKHFGAVPIDRARAGNVVQAWVEEFAQREQIAVTITPEGTRSKVPGWKRGYHRIAVAASVPIVTAALDYTTRSVILGQARTMSGDVERDEAALRSDFTPSMARHPENY